jgi:hypothetical protein
LEKENALFYWKWRCFFFFSYFAIRQILDKKQYSSSTMASHLDTLSRARKKKNVLVVTIELIHTVHRQTTALRGLDPVRLSPQEPWQSKLSGKQEEGQWYLKGGEGGNYNTNKLHVPYAHS